MTIDRRSLIGASLGLGAAVSAARASERKPSPTAPNASDFAPALVPDDGRDQTEALQAAVDSAAEKDIPLVLLPGKFLVSDLRLRRARASSAWRGRRLSYFQAAVHSSRATRPTGSFSTALHSTGLTRHSTQVAATAC
jgi:hypothetical protein